MTVLYVSPDAPALVRAGADALLVLHIGGGTLGMLSGAAALLVRKGASLHRIAGTVFFGSMLCMAGVGAAVSPFLPVPEMANVVAGIMTLYLLATSWMAVKRKDGAPAGRFELAAFFVALGVCVTGAAFVTIALNSATGTIGKTPPEAFYVFMLVGAIAAVSDLKVILQGGICGPARIARHLWRMCVALTIATGSFFLGQPKFLPAFLHGSPLVFVPVFLPLAAMAFWLVKVRLKKRHAAPGAAALAGVS